MPSGHLFFMRSFAILIDGGFVKRKLGSAQEPMVAQRLSAFVERLRQDDYLKEMYLHRVYFYDAEPLTDVVTRPLSGGKLNFRDSDTAKRNVKLHHELSRLPHFALRMGELSFRGWSVKPQTLPNTGTSVAITAADLNANIQQKGVDMRLGMDVASLTLKKLVQVIVLVTGDSDFIPAMKFARREGAQVYLAPIGHNIRDGMYEHADVILTTQ